MARLAVRRTRRSGTGQFRLKKPVWIDPYPFIPGTEPEKRLFEAMVHMGYYFIYQGDLPELADGMKLPVLYTPGFKPDFVLPEYKTILDPFGIFHHSLKEATGDPSAATLQARLGSDAIKAVLYRSLGYAFYHPWWDDRGFLWQDGAQFERLGYDAYAVLDHCKSLHGGIKFPLKKQIDIDAKRQRGYRLGKNIGLGASSVAIANKKRTKPKLLGVKVRRK